MTWRPTRGFRVGAMRERLTVQNFTEAVDSNGQTIRTYATLYADEPSQWVPTGGGESLRGKQVEAGINAVFIVRFRDGYTPELRVVHNDETYGVVYVNQVDGGRRYIELQCKAVFDG